MKVILKASAEKTIFELAEYITTELQMPETANKYIDKILFFASQIATTYPAYTLCKYPEWGKRKLHCATFYKTWMFALKIVKQQVVIFHIVNGKLLNF